MSNTNQIIIPIVASRSHLDTPNLPHPPTLELTPQKHNSPLHLPWKKTASAFKRFRDRKDKHKKHQTQRDMELDNLPSLPSKYHRLITRQHHHTHQIDSLIDPPTEDLTPDYYDPNEAALYQTSKLQQLSEVLLVTNQHQKKKRLSKIPDKSQTQILRPSSYKISSLPACKMEEELVLQTPPPPKSHPDDPFIILRSDHSLRGSKSAKTKFIKKERMSPTLPQPHSEQRPDVIVSRGKVAEKNSLNQQSINSNKIFTPPIQIRQVPWRISAPTTTDQIIQIQSSSESNFEDGQSGQVQAIQCD